MLPGSLRVVSLTNDQYLWHAGERQRHIYILVSGTLYGYFTTEGGKTFCKEVYWQHDLIFAFRSLLMQVPFAYSVKTLEPCQLLRIDLTEYWQLVEAGGYWQNLHQKAVETYFMYKEVKEEFLLLHSPQQRVAYFYQNYPELVSKVPQHIVASYLGMTPISFSRIKKRLAMEANANSQ